MRLSQLLLLALVLTLVHGDIVNEQKSLSQGKIGYFYDSTVDSPCDTVLLIGVGTAMSVDQYNKLSTQIVTGSNMLVIMADANPGSVVKFKEFQYRALANEVHKEIASLIPKCSGDQKPNFIIGGHSASGRAALLAYQHGNLHFHPIGFFGLDPWWVCHKTNTFPCRLFRDEFVELDIPSLSWGFRQSTCGVNPMIAATAAYNVTEPKNRVLYQIQNNVRNDNGMINHCVFTDAGCPSVQIFGLWFGCPMRIEFDLIYKLVGQSAKMFLAALAQPAKFTRAHFELSSNNATLFVNSDQVNEFAQELAFT